MPDRPCENLRPHFNTLLTIMAFIFLALAAAPAAAWVNIPNEIVYQGSLGEGSAQVNEPCDFIFSLWDAPGTGQPPAGGVQIGTTQTAASVDVSRGVFSVALNSSGEFGPDAFNGEARWLQIAVRKTAEGGGYTTLGPRQLLTAAPAALTLRPEARVEAITTNTLLTLINTHPDNKGSAFHAESSGVTVPTLSARHTGDGPSIYASGGGAYPSIQASRNDNGIGVGAFVSSGTGVYGLASDGDGVRGFTTTDDGYPVVGLQMGNDRSTVANFWTAGGLFAGRNGVFGFTSENGGYGAAGINFSDTGNASYGVFGRTDSDTGWAGYFFTSQGNGVFVSTPANKSGLNVVGGSKNAVVATSSGSRKLYTEESTEVWFTDYGFGRIVSDAVEIAIDPLFAETVNLDQPYHVFIQPYGDASLFVARRGKAAFTVNRREGGAACEFSWRLVAKRRAFEEARLDRAPWADNDVNLYPDRQLENGELGQQNGY